MAALTVRNLPAEIVVRLKARADRNGRSMEAEIREILAEATSGQIVHTATGLPIDVAAAQALIAKAARPTRKGRVERGHPLGVRGKPISRSLVEDRR